MIIDAGPDNSYLRKEQRRVACEVELRGKETVSFPGIHDALKRFLPE